MNNMKIRTAMIQYGIKQWQIAEKLGISEASMSRLLRHELPDEEQDRIVKIIEKEAKTK